MDERNKVQSLIKPLICGLCLILTGCGTIGLAREDQFPSAYENDAEENVNIYTAQATVVIEDIDPTENLLKVCKVSNREHLSLAITGATLIQDKYGSPMTAVQLRPGDIAEVAYNGQLEKAGSVTLSSDAWRYESVSKYNLNAGNSSATIGDQTYRLSDDVLVYSDGQPIDVSQIIRQDVLTFNGLGNDIVSITVDQGHGYLDLTNDEALAGGWIEIGQTVISQIMPEMLFTVPEGSYTVRITADGVEEYRDITIERNAESDLDLAGIEPTQPISGRVMFEITPSDAQVFVDDYQINASYAVRLPLGLHQITVQASGYDTITEYFRVEKELTTVRMNLTEKSSVSGNSISAANSAKITIQAPVGVEVYQDNLYKGIAPVTYSKTAGEHTITLRKTGYITRSYSIQVPDDNQNVQYSFSDLEPESTVSGNSVSGNALDDHDDSVSGNSTGNDTKTKTVSGNSVSDNSVKDSQGSQADQEG